MVKARDERVIEPSLQPNIHMEESIEFACEITEVIAYVKSGTHHGAYYKIVFDGKGYSCSCPATVECKHIKMLKEEMRYR